MTSASKEIPFLFADFLFNFVESSCERISLLIFTILYILYSLKLVKLINRYDENSCAANLNINRLWNIRIGIITHWCYRSYNFIMLTRVFLDMFKDMIIILIF